MRMVVPARGWLHGGENLVDEFGHDPLRRLVQHQQPRPGHQRAADREHLLLPAGQCFSALVQPFGQAREQLEHALQRRLAIGLFAKEIAAEAQVVAHRQPRKQPAVLRNEGDPARGDEVLRQALDPLSGEGNRAACADVRGRRSTSAVWTCRRRWLRRRIRSRPCATSIDTSEIAISPL